MCGVCANGGTVPCCAPPPPPPPVLLQSLTRGVDPKDIYLLYNTSDAISKLKGRYKREVGGCALEGLSVRSR